MNIIDVISGAKTSENTIANKVAVRAQAKRIETRAENYVSDILEFFTRESEYISNDLSYSKALYPGETRRVLSSEDKEFLQKKLKDAVVGLPEQLKKALNDIFGQPQEENKQEEKKSVETEATSSETSDSGDSSASENTSVTTNFSVDTTANEVSHFGY